MFVYVYNEFSIIWGFESVDILFFETGWFIYFMRNVYVVFLLECVFVFCVFGTLYLSN